MKTRQAKRRGLTPLGWVVVSGFFILVLLLGNCTGGSEAPSRSVPTVAQEKAEPAEAPTPVPTSTPTPTPTEMPTDTPEPTATPYRIHGCSPDTAVYVSKRGIVHFDSDCSGMKYYTTMTIEQAVNSGYTDFCEHCG